MSDKSDRPAGYVLWGSWYEARTWKDVLVGVATQVYFHRQAQFDEAVRSSAFRGPRRTYLADSSEDMDAPERIGQSPFWIETKFNRQNTMALARRLLKHFGYREGDLRVMGELLPADDPSTTPNA